MKMTKTFTLLATLALGLSVATGTSSVKAATSTADATLESSSDPDKQNVILESVPSIHFGTKTITGSAITFGMGDTTGNEVTTDGKPLQVFNPGLSAAWEVSVSRDDFVAGSKVLKGAKLTFAAGDLTQKDTNDESNLPVTPESLEITDSAKLILDATKEILTTEQKPTGTYPGVGTITDTFTKNNVQLDVPANNTAGEYTANLTWTLQSTPK